ncbi:MAG: hypothetical protein U0M42_01060 [Acutalibacteraceae bacterium]|nr:hypothetical protein [Acutalibacteraceae bacterium]
MAKKIGKQSILFEIKPKITGYGSVAGKKEGQGPFGKYFDYVSDDSLFGEDSYEKAESELQKIAVSNALQRAKLNPSDINAVCAGDLLNQCIGTSFGIRDFGIPFLGVYGACSTMALSLIINSMMIESGFAEHCVSSASSHFCAAERQYRFPLEYGSQRTPTAQWTVTGAGAMVLSKEGNGPIINAACIGKIQDLGVTDQNNMGAAMAPDDVKIRPYPTHEGMVFFYTQIQYLRGFRALFKNFLMQKIVEKTVNEIRC